MNSPTSNQHFWPRCLAVALLIGAYSNIADPQTPGLFVVVLIVSGALLLVGHLLREPLQHLDHRQCQRYLCIGLGLMVLCQILILWRLPVTVYHDPYRVLAQADQLSHGDHTWQTTYFWRYPNNVALAYLLSLWLRLTNLLGWSTNFAVALLDLILLDSFIGLCLRTIRQHTSSKSALLGSVAFFVLTPFAYTYFLQVFYSDLSALLILLLLIRQLLNWPSQRHHWWRGCQLILLVILGQLLKPNMIVLLPTLVIVFWLARHRSHQQKKTLIQLSLVIGLGFLLSPLATQICYRASHYTPETRYQLPVSSWIAMGLDQQTQGTYSDTVIANELKLSSKTAKSQADLTLIKRQIKKMGPLGLLRQWWYKLVILLNVNDIEGWYNGGLRAAPAFYLRHGQFLSLLVSVSYQIAATCLFLSIASKLWFWRPRATCYPDLIRLLTVVLALGYLAFHTLIWETEPRYGQIILPLLLWQATTLPVPRSSKYQAQRCPYVMGRTERQQLVSPVPRKIRWQSLCWTVVAIFTLLSGVAYLSRRYPSAQIIAAQRSQLSTQYHARPQQLAPGEVLTQRVDLHGTANYLALENPAITAAVSLVDLRTKKVHPLYFQDGGYALRQELPAGRYQLQVVNQTTRFQEVSLVSTIGYRLAPYPLIKNGQALPTTSFIFKFIDQPR
ncbi:hypothetical protein [Lapidilactobacillus luobeiensis]|uniref:hypothetical protein n=1 Tax=Lapidilactobacillus luobeiensis TaxID=2950371 RepID=UPI0021C2F03C|nr:hypothetical protein [Lapidilactobacillus luobeiensis]